MTERVALAALLGDTDEQRFADEVWARTAWSRKGGEGPDLTSLLSLDDVDELLAEPCLAHAVPEGGQGRSRPRPRALHARGRGRRAGRGPGRRRPARTGCSPTAARSCFQGLHRAWAPLRAFSDGLARELGHPVQVNAYLTPEGAQGFDAHYDTHDVFVVQTAGTKEWRVHAPVVARPRPEDEWTAAATRSARPQPAIRPRADARAGRRRLPPARLDPLGPGQRRSVAAPDLRHPPLHPPPPRRRPGRTGAGCRRPPVATRSTTRCPWASTVADPAALDALARRGPRRPRRPAPRGRLDRACHAVLEQRWAVDTRPDPLRPVVSCRPPTPGAGGRSRRDVDLGARPGLSLRVEVGDDEAVLVAGGRRQTFGARAADALRRIAAGAAFRAADLVGLGYGRWPQLVRDPPARRRRSSSWTRRSDRTRRPPHDRPTSSPPRCSDLARDRSDALAGSALPTQAFLLVEDPGPWGVEPHPTGGLEPRSPTLSTGWARELSARLLLIRRPGRTTGGPRTWALADMAGGTLRVGTVATAADLGRVDPTTDGRLDDDPLVPRLRPGPPRRLLLDPRAPRRPSAAGAAARLGVGVQPCRW